jgi:hypothetical protein
MGEGEQYPEHDPRHHTRHIRSMLSGVIEHARQDIEKIDDPRGQALFETTAEVLSGLSRAYEHYERRSEAAWR